MKNDKPNIPEPENNDNQTSDGGLTVVHEREREKDNRAEAFRALKKLGRGRRR